MLEMFSLSLFLELVFFCFAIHIFPTCAQCDNPSFVPCPPNDSSEIGGDYSAGGTTSPSDSGIGEVGISPAGSLPVDSLAIDGIQRRDDDDNDGGGDFKSKRQAVFCCRPSPVQCVLLDNGLPACYNPDTTRYFFPDGSYYFTSNSTFFFANGTSTIISPASSGTVAASTAGPTASAKIPGQTLGSAVTSTAMIDSQVPTGTAATETEISTSPSTNAPAKATAAAGSSTAKSGSPEGRTTWELAIGSWAFMLANYLLLENM